MAKSYYSTVFEQSADEIWAAIRDFGSYTWTGSVSESYIEDGKAGTSVGVIRNARLGETNIYHRQRLLAHSNHDRFYTYEFCEPYPYPISNDVITLHVMPITDGNRAFVEWWGTFDCEVSELERWEKYFANEVWAKALRSLRTRLERN